MITLSLCAQRCLLVQQRLMWPKVKQTMWSLSFSLGGQLTQSSSVHAGPPSEKFPASRVGCLRLQKESSQSCCLTFALRGLNDTVTVCLSICAPFTPFSLSSTAFTRHISISRIRIERSPVLVVGSVYKMRGRLLFAVRYLTLNTWDYFTVRIVDGYGLQCATQAAGYF